MKDIYEIEIDELLFNKIASGKCEYFILINDKKGKTYKQNNFLTFVSGDKNLKVSISNLFYFDTIKELLEMLGKEKCGFSSSQTNDKIEDLYFTSYKPEDIENFGLVAIQIEVCEQ